MKHARYGLLLWIAAGAAILNGQPQTLQYNVLYDCSPSDQRFKVFACAGNRDTDSCDVQSFTRAQPGPVGKSPRKMAVDLLKMCHVQTAAEAKADAAFTASRPQSSQASPNAPFKVGDDAYAQGLYSDNAWHKVHIYGTQLDKFQIRYPDGTVATAGPRNLRRTPPGPPPAPPAIAHRGPTLSGKYSSANGQATFEFKGDKVYPWALLLGQDKPMDYEVKGDKIIIGNYSSNEKIEFVRQKDGTIWAPMFGELKRIGQ